MRWMGILGFLPLVLACSAEVVLEGDKGKAEDAPAVHGWSDEPSGGHPCDRQNFIVLDGQKIRVPGLCNPNADPIWDPPPDSVEEPQIRVQPVIR